MRARITLLARFISYLATLLLLLAFSATLQAQTFSLPLQLSNTGLISEIAVDGSGNIYVMWHDESSFPFANVMFTRSTDGGATFSTPAPISGIPGGDLSSPVQIVAESSGTIHVLATSTLLIGPGHSLGQIFYARSTDGGTTFSTIEITDGQGYLGGPVMVLGPDGSVNILWTSLSTSNPVLSRSIDGGATFSTTTIWNWPNSADGSVRSSSIAVDSNEDIYTAFSYATESGATTLACNILFSGSTDQGKTFSSPSNVSDTTACADYPQMTVDGLGNIDLEWADSTISGSNAIFFSRSPDRGVTFSAPAMISQVNADIQFADIAVDSKSNVFVIWGTPALSFTHSSDQGATFSTPQELGNLAGISQIAVDSSGDIDIASLGPSEGSEHIMLMRSTDGGNTFSGPTQISNNAPQSCSGGPRMALDKTGDIDITWQGWSPGDCAFLPNQVYFSRGIVGNFTITAAPPAERLGGRCGELHVDADRRRRFQ